MSSAHAMPMSAGEWSLLLALSAIWGCTFFLVAIALRELPFWWVAAARVGLAALMLHAVVPASGIPYPRGVRAWGRFLVLGLVNNAVPFALIFWAQTHIASALAAVPPATLAMPGPATWSALVALARVCAALGCLLYFRILKTAGATNLLLTTLLIPVGAVVLGTGLLGEMLEPRHLAGMALIAAGLLATDGRALNTFGSLVRVPHPSREGGQKAWLPLSLSGLPYACSAGCPACAWWKYPPD